MSPVIDLEVKIEPEVATSAEVKPSLNDIANSLPNTNSTTPGDFTPITGSLILDTDSSVLPTSSRLKLTAKPQDILYTQEIIQGVLHSMPLAFPGFRDWGGGIFFLEFSFGIFSFQGSFNCVILSDITSICGKDTVDYPIVSLKTYCEEWMVSL